MKKLVVTVVGLLCLTSTAFADNWGVGLRAGAAQNDPKDLKEAYDEAFDWGYSEKELTKGYGVFGLEGLYEWDLNDNGDMLGVRLGIDLYGDSKLSLDWGDEKFTESTYAIPLTVYYKKDNGIKNWSWFAGAGLTIIHSEVEYKATGWPTESWSKSKVFPHITAGAEYRFCKLFALGAELRYNIAAKVKKEDLVLSDRSGIAGRFYF